MSNKDHYLDDALDKARREVERFARKYVRRTKHAVDGRIRERRKYLEERALPFDAEMETDHALFIATDGVLGQEWLKLPGLGEEIVALTS